MVVVVDRQKAFSPSASSSCPGTNSSTFPPSSTKVVEDSFQRKILSFRPPPIVLQYQHPPQQQQPTLRKLTPTTTTLPMTSLPLPPQLPLPPPPPVIKSCLASSTPILTSMLSEPTTIQKQAISGVPFFSFSEFNMQIYFLIENWSTA